MFDALAHHLAEVGILVFRFDFSGCDESEGDYSQTSLSKLKSDLSSILKFVRSQDEVDASKIGILGQSFGTATTIALEPQVECLVMMGAVAHPKESLIKLFGRDYNPEGVSSKLRSAGTVTRVGPQFWQDFENHHLLESIKKLQAPILFIHGENDDKVPLSDMEAYFHNANEPKDKIVLEGVDHGLRPHRDKMYKIVVDWFSKHLLDS